MQLWKFKGAEGKTASTSDETGSNLPSEHGPWEPIGSTRIEPGDGPRIGASSEQILADVAKDGYSIWPRED